MSKNNTKRNNATWTSNFAELAATERFTKWLQEVKHVSPKRFDGFKEETRMKYLQEFSDTMDPTAKNDVLSASETAETEMITETEKTSENVSENVSETAETVEETAEKEAENGAQITEQKEVESPLEVLLNLVKSEFSERPDFSYHVDPKKKKVMVRWSGSKMLFKVFLQKNGVKVHLKKEEDWKAYPAEVQPFYQNGFNLPYAVKMTVDDFSETFLPWCNETYYPIIMMRKATKKSESAPAEQTAETEQETAEK